MTYNILYVIIGARKDVIDMKAVNYSQFRSQMKDHMDLVTDSYETVVVTRKENRNVVMISEEAYNNLLENAYLMGNKANYDWLAQSKAQYEAGKAKPRTLVEADDE